MSASVEPARPRDQVAAPLVDRSDRSANIGRLLAVGLVLLAIVGMFLVLPERLVQPLTLALLAVLSMLGVFFIFALAIGFVKLTARTNSETFARAFVDGLEHGTVVTDWDGRIVYANQAYGKLTGVEDGKAVETVERVFARSDEASEIVYRMNQSVRAGTPVTQEFRMVQDVRALNSDDPDRADFKTPHWYRVTGRQMTLPGAGPRLYGVGNQRRHE